jgi:hypothetical protein
MVRRGALDGIRFDEEGPIGFGDFVVWFRSRNDGMSAMSPTGCGDTGFIAGR